MTLTQLNRLAEYHRLASDNQAQLASQLQEGSAQRAAAVKQAAWHREIAHDLTTYAAELHVREQAAAVTPVHPNLP